MIPFSKRFTLFLILMLIFCIIFFFMILKPNEWKTNVDYLTSVVAKQNITLQNLLLNNNKYKESIGQYEKDVAQYKKVIKQYEKDVALYKQVITRYNDAFEHQINFRAVHRLEERDLNNLPLSTFSATFRFKSKNFLNFYNQLLKQFVQQKHFIQKSWSIENEDLLKTLYFTNVVSNMYNLGLDSNAKGSSCILKNYIKSTNINYFSIYMTSKNACCNDYAYMLKALLDYANITNRLVRIPGHIFNEVKIGNKWQVFDATINWWIHNSWDHTINGPINDPVIITFFPRRDMIYSNKETYRKVPGIGRYAMLVRVTKKTKSHQHKNITYIKDCPVCEAIKKGHQHIKSSKAT